MIESDTEYVEVDWKKLFNDELERLNEEFKEDIEKWNHTREAWKVRAKKRKRKKLRRKSQGR